MNEVKILKAEKFHINFHYDNMEFEVEGVIVSSGCDLYFIIEFLLGERLIEFHRSANITVKVDIDTNEMTIFDVHLHADRYPENPAYIRKWQVARKAIETYLKDNS